MSKIRYWDRRPGRFVNFLTGEALSGPSFTGNTREWYHSLYEIIKMALNDDIKDDGVNLVTSIDVNSILENLMIYRPSMEYDMPDGHDNSSFVNKFKFMGTLGNKIRVYCDKTAPCNRVDLIPANQTVPEVTIKILGMEIF